MQQSLAGRQNLFGALHQPRGVTAWVLDTNVVLDLLVFSDPHCRQLGRVLAGKPGRWHATRRMREEFDAVLARPGFDRWASRREGAQQSWEQWACMVDTAPPCGSTLRCRDPDDQMFVDLAHHIGNCQLLSRDREVLRLQGAAAKLGIHISAPADTPWSSA